MFAALFPKQSYHSTYTRPIHMLDRLFSQDNTGRFASRDEVAAETSKLRRESSKLSRAWASSYTVRTDRNPLVAPLRPLGNTSRRSSNTRCRPKRLWRGNCLDRHGAVPTNAVVAVGGVLRATSAPLEAVVSVIARRQLPEGREKNHLGDTDQSFISSNR